MGRVRVLVAAAIAIVLGALAGAGCSSLQPKIDGAAIERAIEQSARDRFSAMHAVVGSAHCPRGRVQHKGDHFTCHVTVDHQDVVYDVRQTSGHGDITFDLASPFLLFSTIDDQTLEALRQQGLDDATVACGYAHIWFVNPPVKRDCVVTLPDHTTHTAHVSIAADGGVAGVNVDGL